MHTTLLHDWRYAVLYWAVFVWAYAPEFGLNQRSRPLSRQQDAGSFRFVIMVQALAMFAGYAVAFAGRFGAMDHRRAWFVVGLCVLVMGSLLRRHCFRMLGESFTAIVVVRPEQQVVERGAYALVRHPSYTAGILMLTGGVLALANWLSVTIVACGAVLAYSYRVRVEERALLAALGEP